MNRKEILIPTDTVNDAEVLSKEERELNYLQYQKVEELGINI